MSARIDAFTPSIFKLLQANPRMQMRHAVAISALGTFLGGKDHCWPSLDSLGELIGRSRGLIGRWLKECASLGYIVIEERHVEGTRGRRSNLYRIAAAVMRAFVRPAAPQQAKQPPRTPPKSPPRPAMRGVAAGSRPDSPVCPEGVKEATNDSERGEPERERGRGGSVVGKIRSGVEAFARRARAPCGIADPEQRRQRRIQKLMEAAAPRLTFDERIAFNTLFMEAPLEDQRRAMDRLELVAQLS
jgi:hypothetical protein